MTLALALTGLAAAATLNQDSTVSADPHAAPPSVPRSLQDVELLPHPGQNGALDAQQIAMAGAAWRYFQNNFQPTTCLYNSVDKYPSTTMWDVASSIAALTAAFEFQWIPPAEFDAKMSCLLDSLNRMPLYHGELPNKAYDTASLVQVGYDDKPAEIGVSAIDLGRLLTWLAIVKDRYPRHADAIDRAVLRWSFCNVVHPGGTLYGADAGDTWLQEGRLGYEEYAATGFQLWGFDTTEASSLAPYAKVKIDGVPILYDARDPARFGAHNYVVTEAYLLAGLEMNWDLASDKVPSDVWMSDADGRALAKRVYQAQYKRWKSTGTLTARTEHQVEGPPYFVYDTVFSDGVPWNTLADTGQRWPELAAVSTKAALGMSVLFDTKYTDLLANAVYPLIDPNRGVFEGYYEDGGKRIESLTANTNGIVLESLLYKLQGKLNRDNGLETLWDQVPNAEFKGTSQCLPRSVPATRAATEANRPAGTYEADRQVADRKD